MLGRGEYGEEIKERRFRIKRMKNMRLRKEI